MTEIVVPPDPPAEMLADIRDSLMTFVHASGMTKSSYAPEQMMEYTMSVDVLLLNNKLPDVDQFHLILLFE